MGFMEFNEENCKESLYKYRAYISLTVHIKILRKWKQQKKILLSFIIRAY